MRLIWKATYYFQMPLLLTGCLAISVLAQEAQKNNQADIPTLVKSLKSKDKKVANDAADALVKIGQPAIQPVVEMLKKEKGCSERTLAADVLIGIDPDNEAIVPALVGVVKDVCALSLQKDSDLRTDAALHLYQTAAGVRALGELLHDKNKYVRRFAAYAISELSELFFVGEPDKSIIKALEDILPRIGDAHKYKDKMVDEFVTNVLVRLSSDKIVKNEELRRIAQKSLEQSTK